jgi:hypothetical protein
VTNAVEPWLVVVVAYFVAVAVVVGSVVTDSMTEVAHNWGIIAIVAVDIADIGLVVLAFYNPPYNVTSYTFNSVCLCSTTQSLHVSNEVEYVHQVFPE